MVVIIEWYRRSKCYHHQATTLKTMTSYAINTLTKLLLSFLLLQGGVQIAIAQQPSSVALNSYSFNAKQRSHFTIAGQKEAVQRGLTLLHFNTPSTYEFRTYDTYGSDEELTAALETMRNMKKNGAVFAILAHDSATKGAFKQSKALTEMGFSQLASLKGRQAYVMHNLKGEIYEQVDDVKVTLTVPITNDLNDGHIYFPKEKYEFEPSADRYIAHAGGVIDGHAYTNCKEALDRNYAKGFRLFELDIIKTSDGKMVAAHDWKMWSRFTDYSGPLPPTLEEFKKHTIYGDYTTLDMQGINDWFKAHPDAILVTDKLPDPLAFAEKFIDKNRLVMELFSEMAIEEASRNGIKPMISQTPLLKLKGDKLNYLAVNNVKYVAVSRRIIQQQKKLMLQLRDAGIKVYVYNVNFDPGKDERYVYDNELGLVYGMYADNWVFDLPEDGPLK